jgi:hypothetical protein
MLSQSVQHAVIAVLVQSVVVHAQNAAIQRQMVHV